jgi:hypothetical protein
MRVTLYRRCANSQVIAFERSAPALFGCNVLLTPFWQQPASPSDSSLRPCAQIIRSHQCRIGQLLPWAKFGSLDGNQVVSSPVQTCSSIIPGRQRWSEMRLTGLLTNCEGNTWTQTSLLSLGVTTGTRLDGFASGWTGFCQFR